MSKGCTTNFEKEVGLCKSATTLKNKQREQRRQRPKKRPIFLIIRSTQVTLGENPLKKSHLKILQALCIFPNFVYSWKMAPYSNFAICMASKIDFYFFANFFLRLKWREIEIFQFWKHLQIDIEDAEIRFSGIFFGESLFSTRWSDILPPLFCNLVML